MGLELFIYIGIATLGFLATVEATCADDPLVTQEIGTCIEIVTNPTATTDDSPCVTSVERERLQSLVQESESCMEDVFASFSCEETFVNTYRSYVTFAYVRANNFRCADECRNDTELINNLEQCFHQTFPEDPETLSCEAWYNLTEVYSACTWGILQFSGCQFDFSNEWSAGYDALDVTFQEKCASELTCFDDREFFNKAAECLIENDQLQIQGYDLQEYCSRAFPQLTSCIEGLLVNLTCDKSFYEFVQMTYYSDLQQTCSTQSICDHKLMQCLNGTTFTFEVDTSDLQQMCSKLHLALQTGEWCLDQDYGCSPEKDLIEGLDHSMQHHWGLYSHMCEGGKNCIFDTEVTEKIEACFNSPWMVPTSCGTMHKDHHDSTINCYSHILDKHSCNQKSVGYYHRLQQYQAMGMAVICNAECMDSDKLLENLHTCQVTTETELNQITADFTSLRQKADLCSGIEEASQTLVTCVRDVLDTEMCQTWAFEDVEAQASIYSQIQTLLCDADIDVIQLALECQSFEEVWDAIVFCSAPILSKSSLIQGKSILDTESACQDIEYLDSDAMQCLTSKLYSLDCPIDLPLSLTGALDGDIDKIKQHCTDIPVVAGGSRFEVSKTVHLVFVLMSWPLLQLL